VTGRKFYDLNKNPVISPYTGEVVPIAPVAASRGSRAEVKATEAAEPELETTEAEGAEFVSLEDADAEAQGKKVDAEVAEGAEDIELEDDTVDGVLCRWSYMLLGDPARALQETRRVLRPDGRLAFSTWGPPERNAWMTVPAGVILERGLMEPFSSEGPGVFALSSRERLARLLAGAGFGEVAIEEMEVRWRFDPDELWTVASELMGPVALAIGTLRSEERREVRAAIEERAADFLSDGAYELPGLSLNVAAR
jgi:uncharacterized protein (TIGR02300 family)